MTARTTTLAAVVAALAVGCAGTGTVPPSPDVSTAAVVASAPADPGPARVASGRERVGAPDLPRSARRWTLVEAELAPGIDPVRVRLARVGIDAPVVPAGLDEVGAFDVPPTGLTGWYDRGPRPGQGGTEDGWPAVIAGHVDSAATGLDVFGTLHRAEIGDGIEVAADDGTTLTYRVTAVEQHAKTEAPALVWRDGPDDLVLITCGGAFDRERRSYVDNILVRAELVGPAVTS